MNDFFLYKIHKHWYFPGELVDRYRNIRAACGRRVEYEEIDLHDPTCEECKQSKIEYESLTIE